MVRWCLGVEPEGEEEEEVKRNRREEDEREHKAMLCLKAEALGRQIYSSHGAILPVNLGSSIQRAMQMQRGGRGEEGASSSASSSGDASAGCSVLEDGRSNDCGRSRGRGGKICQYRYLLEQEVKRLQTELQEEIDLHVALANAVGNSAMPLLNSPSKLPDKVQELLANIAALEITVLKLEEKLVTLHFRLTHERNERGLAENNLKYMPSLSQEPSSCVSGYMWEEHISSLRVSKICGSQLPHSLQPDILSGCGYAEPISVVRLSDICQDGEVSGSCSRTKDESKVDASLQQLDSINLKKTFTVTNLWSHPNELSEEMVWCMRNIFLCLSDSSSISSKTYSSSSPVGHLSRSSLTSFSDSSIIPSLTQSPPPELHYSCDELSSENSFDPYKANEKVNQRNIGSYKLVAEVSWMYVGKAQLDYAAEALKRFRFLVEQLAKVNPACMSNNERLAFWINLYNALIMHAYLAYGVPKSDIKLFALMQKASYTVGGHSFSAADIEFVLLKMKPPAYRPQMALILAVHNFKISEEHRKYAIDSPEPLVLFALSCGMYSSPAVRIFKADNVHEELQNSMRDYIRASIGISDKGKLLVPKLLHSFARGVVEDSLLVDWICRYLSPDQVSVVRDSMSQRKQRLLGVRSFSIVPFDSRFRYLFLPTTHSSLSAC